MTIVRDDNRTGAAATLAAVRVLLPEIAARAPEIEAARRVPLDLLDKLKTAGCFRLLRPTSHGGSGSDLAGALSVYEELGRADASTAWVSLIGGAAWVDLAGLPRATFDAVFPPGDDTIVAGVFSPNGTAEPMDGGYVIDGRWGFASGCEHADWFYGNCIDTTTGEPRFRIAVLHPEEIEIEDTWSVVGLRGTGSHHVRVRGVPVPAERTFSLFEDPPCVDSPLVRIPVPTLASMLFSGVAVGVARGALDDVTELAAGKVPLLSPSTLAANPLFQYQLADADVRLRAARELAYAEAAALWDAALAGDELTPALRARARSAAAHAVTTAATVVDAAYQAGGGASLYDSSPLQRRLRDSRALTQHFLLKADTLTTCGAVLAGQQPDLHIF